MIEFVTKHGHRFPVDCGRGIATMPSGEMRVICRKGDGYVIHYHGNEIFGTLRVKACSSRYRDVPQEVALATFESYMRAASAMGERSPVLYFGDRVRILSVTSHGSSGPWSAKFIPWVDVDA